jgi:osmotically-inducible protein OsmY
MGKGIALIGMGILGAALVGETAVAATQTETLQQAEQEAEKASEQAKRAGEEATQAGEEAGKAAKKEAKKEAEKATQQVEEAGAAGKKEIEKETESAKKQIEEAAKGEPSTPADLQERLNAMLAKDSNLRGSKIEAKVEDGGVATLSGTVPSEKARTKAVELTRNTKGITEVRNELEIARADPR